MPKIYDNIELNFEDGLLEHLKAADRVDYCVGYFNLRGWRSVYEEIDTLKGMDIDENGTVQHRYCRLLIGMLKTPKELLHDAFENGENLLMDNDGANKHRKRLALELAEQLTVGIPSQQDEIVLRKLLVQLKNGKVAVKLFLAHQLHAKLYLAHCSSNITPRLGLLGSSNFTFSGLCAQGELNIDVIEQDAATKLDKWFNDRWNDRWCIDITKELIAILEQSWVRVEKIPPYHIYLKIAYHLSQEARAGLAEFNVPDNFREELLDFQQKAVQITAHHLHKRQGVMIGDVVGLGKTITASAVAKIMEEDFNYNTLILCPKNLVSMWKHYRDKYDLRAKVLSQGVIATKLPKLKRYRLIIVDESHNFRNGEGRRYKVLKDYIEQNDSDVVLLSATPYNKSYYDLASQLKLFLPEDFDLGISPERYIKSLGGSVQFYAKHTDTHIRTIKAFEKSDYADDWRELMKLYLVRRTRSFIKNNYADADTPNGRKYLTFADGRRAYFPDRIPKKVEFEMDTKNKSDQYAMLYDEKIVELIDKMELPRYGLQIYRDERFNAQLSADERSVLDNLSRAGKRVKGFCRTNLYKRLESSGYAFLLSVSRHILRNYIFIYAVENGLKLPVAGQSVDIDLFDDADEDNDFNLNLNFDWTAIEYEKHGSKCYNDFVTEMKNRFDWINSQIFKRELLLEHLRKDSDTLLEILSRIKIWNPDGDRKLIALHDLITKHHKDEKVLIFTQFADTAEYIFEYLKKKSLTKIALVVGGSDNITNLVERFSPLSNECPDICGTSEELRVLVTTDVLSEGQNLQDAHIILNFDLPWALVRLIQRAGRVDRLGQKSEEILCYSFLPEDGIEKIIKLRAKLKTRIKENAEVVGSDEVFFDGDPVNIADLYSGKTGIFDEPEDSEVDLASVAYQIWKNAIDKKPELKKIIETMPNVVYSAKENRHYTEFAGNGVIVYAKTGNNNDCMVLLDEKGQVITQSQYKILKAAECDSNTPPLEKLSNHHDLVKQGIGIISRDDINISGTLGRKYGIRYRTFMKLDKLIKDAPLFATDKLKKAMDDIYRYSLKEFAVDTLSRQLKTGISDMNFADLVISLKENDKLCNVIEEVERKTTQIICSLSLVKENR